MKNILYILLLLPFSSLGQQHFPHGNATSIDSFRGTTVSRYTMLQLDTAKSTQWSSNGGAANLSGTLYLYDGSKWVSVSGGGGGGSGTVTSVATNTGTGITGGTITTSGTIAADTFLLDTRKWRQKGIDSVNTTVALRVKYTDTASMLSNYLSGMLASVKYTDTASMLAGYTRVLRFLDTTTNHWSAIMGLQNQIDTLTYVPWSVVSAVQTGNSIVQRDGGGNIAANNIFLRSTSTTSNGGTVTLNVNSARMQVLTGSANETYKMPNATTLTDNTIYEFNNNSTGNLYIVDNGSNALYTFPAGAFVRLTCLSTATSNGVWEAHGFLPHSITAGDAGLNFTASASITGTVDWDGNIIAVGNGGTGATTTTSVNGTPITYGANNSLPIGSGTVTSVAAGYGTTFTTITASGSVVVDTNKASGICTNLWRQKAVDSLNTLIAAKGAGTVTNVIGGVNISITGTSTIQPTVNITGTIAVANGGTGTTATTSVNTTPITYGSDNTITASANTLTTTTLNPTVVNSSLTKVGTITSGTWNGTVVAPAYGGTGVSNNAASTITISGSYPLTATLTTTTNVTLPSSGTLYGTASGSITSSQLRTSLTDETGTGVFVTNDKPTFLGTIQTVTAMSGQALDGSLGNWFTRTLAGNETFTQSNFSTNQCFILELKQGSGTSYTWTPWSGITWVTSGGTAPTLTTTSNGITTIGCRCTGSNTFICYLVGTQ